MFLEHLSGTKGNAKICTILLNVIIIWWGRCYHNFQESWGLERFITQGDLSANPGSPASGNTTPFLTPPDVCLWIPLLSYIVIIFCCFWYLQNSLCTGMSWWVIIRPRSVPTGPEVVLILPPHLQHQSLRHLPCSQGAGDLLLLEGVSL